MTDLSVLFNSMPERFHPEKAAGTNMTLMFDLAGDGGGQWNVEIADGKLEVHEGEADNPTATIKMNADDFQAMSTGSLNPMMAFMSGKVKVEGDLNSVMKFQSLVGF